MTPKKTLTVEGTLENLETLQGFVAAELENAGALPRTIERLRLAIEELYTNIVKYAFDRDSEKTVTVTVEQEEGAVRIIMCDKGRPFNPLDFPPPDLSADLEHKQPGRLGIHLVRTMIDRVFYERIRDSNCVILENRLQ